MEIPRLLAGRYFDTRPGNRFNSAIFSFISAFLLRPLPYHDAERLVRITSVRGNEEGRLLMLELKDLISCIYTEKPEHFSYIYKYSV
jgi:hypothetical protein